MSRTDGRCRFARLSLAMLAFGAESALAQEPVRVVPAPAPAATTVRTSPSDAIWNDEDEPDAAEMPRVQIRRVVVNQNAIERAIFGNAPEPSREQRLDSLLTLRIREIESTFSLSEAQRAKVRLAGLGDIKHFYDRLSAARRADFSNPEVRARVAPELEALKTEFLAGPFGDDSLFHKTLARVVGEQEIRRYRDLGFQRRRLQQEAQIDVAVLSLGQSVGLHANQRARLRELLQKVTAVPTRIGPYDVRVVLCQAGRLPDEMLRPLFTDGQWPAVKRQIENALLVEPFLKKNGFLAEDANPLLKSGAPAAKPGRKGYIGR